MPTLGIKQFQHRKQFSAHLISCPTVHFWAAQFGEHEWLIQRAMFPYFLLSMHKFPPTSIKYQWPDESCSSPRFDVGDDDTVFEMLLSDVFWRFLEDIGEIFFRRLPLSVTVIASNNNGDSAGVASRRVFFSADVIHSPTYSATNESGRRSISVKTPHPIGAPT